MSSNMERVAAMPDASLYVNRDGRRADDCVDSHGGGNLTKIPRSGGDSQKFSMLEMKFRSKRISPTIRIFRSLPLRGLRCLTPPCS